MDVDLHWDSDPISNALLKKICLRPKTKKMVTVVCAAQYVTVSVVSVSLCPITNLSKIPDIETHPPNKYLIN